jgi:hypothetical protein
MMGLFANGSHLLTLRERESGRQDYRCEMKYTLLLSRG